MIHSVYLVSDGGVEAICSRGIAAVLWECLHDDRPADADPVNSAIYARACDGQRVALRQALHRRLEHCNTIPARYSGEVTY